MRLLHRTLAGGKARRAYIPPPMWSFKSAEGKKYLRYVQKAHLEQTQTTRNLSNYKVFYITSISYMSCIELQFYIILYHIISYIYIYTQTQLHWPCMSICDIQCKTLQLLFSLLCFADALDPISSRHVASWSTTSGYQDLCRTVESLIRKSLQCDAMCVCVCVCQTLAATGAFPPRCAWPAVE